MLKSDLIAILVAKRQLTQKQAETTIETIFESMKSALCEGENIEIRGLGIRRIEHVGEAVVGLIVDLAAEDSERLPATEALTTRIDGVELPRIPVNLRYSPLPLIVAALTTTDGTASDRPSADCRKEIANHISPTIATE